MKFFSALILTMLFAFIGGLYLPWWVIAPVAFVIALVISQKPWKAALAGFLAVFLLWFMLAMWINSANEGLLAGRISQLLGVGTGSFALILISSFIGGVVAALAALSGSLLRPRKTIK